MKNTDLYRGIGEADDKYIKSAVKAFEKGENREKKKEAGRIIRNVLSVAAAVVIIGGLWVVSFIGAQNRQEPTTSANTGDSTFDGSETSSPDNINGEPSTEADTTHILSPSDTKRIEIDPDSVCGKMIQSFDLYLKTKKSGKYGDYYVSYCVKVNGAYIGFIDDGQTDYTLALEIKTVDGLPFCYGDGQDLTVINNGVYRYGLEAAFADGLINEDELDQLFVEFSSDCSALYNEFKYSFIRQSCDEALNGETLYDVNLSEKRAVTLYNYIDIPFCYKISDTKYAVLYQILHDPVEENADEYYDITAGDHVFSVRVGERLNIIDGGEIYGLDKAGLSEKELSDLFGYYSRHLIQSKNPETEIYKYGIEKYLESGKTTYYDDYAVIYAYKTGKGTYIAKIMLSNKGYMPYVSTEEIAGITVTYTSSLPFTVIKGDELCIGLSKAYEKGLITADEINEMNEDYKVFLQKNDDPVTTPVTDEFEWLDFTNTDRITDAEKAKELSGVFDEYLRGEQNPGIYFCVKLGNGKYAALLERHISPLCIESTENVGGYPIHYSNYRKMTVLYGDTAYFGLQNAYEHNVLTDSDAHEIFTSYRDAFRSNYEDEMLCSLLVGCFREYLNGNMLAYRNSGYEGKVTFYKFINIEFCAELSANKYAALFSIIDQEIPEFDEMSVIVSDHEFIYKKGLELKILNIDNISGLSEGVLTGVELDSLYGSYEEYLSKNNNGRAPWDIPKLREMFETFIKTGEAYNVDYAYKTKDGIYIGLLTKGDAIAWDETVAGCTFYHANGNKFLIIKDDTLIEGIDVAYEQGVISAETVKKFHDGYVGIRN